MGRLRELSRWLPGALALILVACSATPAAPPVASPPAAAPPAAAEAAPTSTPPSLLKLEVPTATLSATSTPLWVAVDYGFFRRYGFDAEVKGLAPAAATQAIQSGSVPFGATAGSTVTAFVGGARELVYIAGLLNKVLFQLVAQPEVARVEDLRGKAVGTSTAGSSAAIALTEALRRYGLEPDRDVAVLYLRDQPGILTGLLSGQIAAGFLASPYNRQARVQGYRLLLDTADLDIAILGLNITTTRGVIERERDTARRFLMAYIEAIEFARRQPAATIESIMRGTRNDDRALAEEAYQLYRAVWDPWPSAQAIQTFLDNLDVPGARDVRPEQLIDDSLLQELEASGWLAAHLSPP
ncbi:MAG TPA: ABC transporter substrate-binding protein [Chloroflexota bacterium]|nr:ABC transporter substrate-binding protein [Chloroflexota bacterium]